MVLLMVIVTLEPAHDLFIAQTPSETDRAIDRLCTSLGLGFGLIAILLGLRYLGLVLALTWPVGETARVSEARTRA